MSGDLLYNNICWLCIENPEPKGFRTVIKKGMFAVPNKEAFQHVMYFLLNVIDKEKCKAIPWPVADRNHELEFQSAVLKRIKELSTEFPEARIPHIVPSLFKAPGGEKFCNLALQLSALALHTHLKEKSGRSMLNWPVVSRSHLHAAKLRNIESFTRSYTNKLRKQKSEILSLASSISDARLQIEAEKLQLKRERERSFQVLHKLVERSSLSKEMKNKLLDLGNTRVIEEWKLNQIERTTFLDTTLAKLRQYSMPIKDFRENIHTSESLYLSPAILDGLQLHLACPQTEQYIEMQMLCKKMIVDNKLNLVSFFELAHLLLTAFLDKLKKIHFPHVKSASSHIEEVLKEFNILGDKIQKNWFAACCINTRLNETIARRQQTSRIIQDAEFPYQATPPLLFTKDIAAFDGNGAAEILSLTPVSGSCFNIRKRKVELNTEFLSTLVIPSSVKKGIHELTELPTATKSSITTVSSSQKTSEKYSSKRTHEICKRLLSTIQTMPSQGLKVRLEKNSYTLREKELLKDGLEHTACASPVKEKTESPVVKKISMKYHPFQPLLNSSFCSAYEESADHKQKQNLKILDYDDASVTTIPGEETLNEVVQQMVMATPAMDHVNSFTEEVPSPDWSDSGTRHRRILSYQNVSSTMSLLSPICQNSSWANYNELSSEKSVTDDVPLIATPDHIPQTFNNFDCGSELFIQKESPPSFLQVCNEFSSSDSELENEIGGNGHCILDFLSSDDILPSECESKGNSPGRVTLDNLIQRLQKIRSQM